MKEGNELTTLTTLDNETLKNQIYYRSGSLPSDYD